MRSLGERLRQRVYVVFVLGVVFAKHIHPCPSFPICKWTARIFAVIYISYFYISFIQASETAQEWGDRLILCPVPISNFQKVSHSMRTEQQWWSPCLLINHLWHREYWCTTRVRKPGFFGPQLPDPSGHNDCRILGAHLKTIAKILLHSVVSPLDQ